MQVYIKYTCMYISIRYIGSNCIFPVIDIIPVSLLGWPIGQQGPRPTRAYSSFTSSALTNEANGRQIIIVIVAFDSGFEFRVVLD